MASNVYKPTVMLIVGGLLSIRLARAKVVHLGHVLSLKQPHLHHTLRSQNVFSFLQPTHQAAVKANHVMYSARLGCKKAA